MEVGAVEVRKDDIQHVIYASRCYKYHLPGAEPTQHAYREKFHFERNSENIRE